eukprot:8996315-Alexandrium_andersonii.AAC.1
MSWASRSTASSERYDHSLGVHPSAPAAVRAAPRNTRPRRSLLTSGRGKGACVAAAPVVAANHATATPASPRRASCEA